MVFAGVQQPFCIPPRPAEEYFLTAKSTPSQSRKYPPLNSSQKALQPCLKKTGSQTEGGNSPSRAGVRTTVALKVGQDLELGTQIVTNKKETTGE